jgi:predicted nucleotidyltransferase
MSLKSIREQNRKALISRLADKLRERVDRSRVEAVYLFGSWARGDFDGFSDIDLLVIVKPGISEEDFDFDAFEVDSEHPLEVIVSDGEAYRRSVEKGETFYSQIEREKVVLIP